MRTATPCCRQRTSSRRAKPTPGSTRCSDRPPAAMLLSLSVVNDQPVSVAALRRVGEGLVEIVGQFEQRGLLDNATHRELLDSFGRLGAPAAAVAAAWQHWQDTTAARDAAEAALAQARRDEDFLRHAVAELDALKPEPGEEQRLADTRLRLMNREKLAEAFQGAGADLSGQRGAE